MECEKKVRKMDFKILMNIYIKFTYTVACELTENYYVATASLFWKKNNHNNQQGFSFIQVEKSFYSSEIKL